MAPNPAVLAAAIKAALSIPNVTIYDGYVPERVPEAGGYILPYVVIFAGTGTDLPAQRNLSQLADTDVLDWICQTQCVGADANTARTVAFDVKARLTNLHVPGGWLKPDDDAFSAPSPLPDMSTTPVRFFMPLRWRATTT